MVVYFGSFLGYLMVVYFGFPDNFSSWSRKSGWTSLGPYDMSKTPIVNLLRQKKGIPEHQWLFGHFQCSRTLVFGAGPSDCPEHYFELRPYGSRKSGWTSLGPYDMSRAPWLTCYVTNRTFKSIYGCLEGCSAAEVQPWWFSGGVRLPRTLS